MTPSSPDVGGRDESNRHHADRGVDLSGRTRASGRGARLVGGEIEAGYLAAMTTLARGRVHIAAIAAGTAQRALDESVAYAAAATQGAPWPATGRGT